jgi:tetratricopeptide (TPR) repeat protein
LPAVTAALLEFLLSPSGVKIMRSLISKLGTVSLVALFSCSYCLAQATTQPSPAPSPTPPQGPSAEPVMPAPNPFQTEPGATTPGPTTPGPAAPSTQPGTEIPGQIPGQTNPFLQEGTTQPPGPTPPGRSTTEEGTTQPPSNTPAAAQIIAARHLINDGKYDEAIKRLQVAIKLNPDATELEDACFFLGSAYRMLNRYDDAIDAYSEAIHAKPDNPDPESYLRRGIVWFYKGEYGVAWDDFDDASRILNGTSGDEPQPEFWKGLAKAKQNEWLDAINSYGEALRTDARFTPAYVNRGLAYLVINEPKKAIDDFDQAIRLDPKNAETYFKRGVAQGRDGRWQDAIDSYTQALRLNPKYAAAYFNRSIAYSRLGDQSRSQRDRAAATSLNPQIEHQLTSAG